MIVRWAKVFLTACVGVLMLLVGLDNIFDYATNFAVVQHILSMDTLPPGAAFTWRAIAAPPAHHLAYALIIAVEIGSGALCLVGAGRLVQARSLAARAFNAAKGLAIAGLVAAFALYFLGFLIVGGEWFEMWRSNGWNMQDAAFRFIGAIGLVLLFVAQPDEDL